MHLALYRKWRPALFSDVISQEHITTILQHQVAKGSFAHAYLFTGSRGTGKTTCARILAKAINCLHPKDGNPCLECEICKGIEDGSILDITEMDAASNNGVEDVRLLREEANFVPSVCRYRVYIIDEAHMLSNSAFNALLKIMEEPPPHVLFILATTEVHKIPATIASRCQRYDFKRIKAADIAARLKKIAEAEGLTLTEGGASLLARLSDGGMRDALSLLEQTSAFSDVIDESVVSSAVGIAQKDEIFDLAEAVRNQDAAKALSIVSALYESGKAIDRLADDFISHFRDLMLLEATGDGEDLLLLPPNEIKRLKDQASAYTLPRILSVITELQQALIRLSRTKNQKIELEMTLVCLCAKEPLSLSAAQTTQPARVSEESDPLLLQRISKLEQTVLSLSEQRKSVSPTPPRKNPPAEPTPIPAKATVLECWGELLEELRQNEPALHAMLIDSTAYKSGEVIIIDSPNTMLKSLLLTDNIGAKLADEIERKLGSRHRLRIAKKETLIIEENSGFSDILKKAGEQHIETELY